MNRRFMTYIVLLSGWLVFAGRPFQPAGAVQRQPLTGKPNILLIIADDLNWRDLGVTGSPDVKSPNIDRLAREAMNLRGMFTPAPTCSPTRHALYTGLYSMRSGAYPNHTMVDKGTHSVFTSLKNAGYRVGLQAKTHVQPQSSFPYEVVVKWGEIT